MLTARLVDVAPRPLGLARAVRDRPGAVLLWDATGGRSFVACDPVEESHALDPEPSLPLRPWSRDFGKIPRWIGLLPYECRRELERVGSSGPADRRPEPDLLRPLWKRYAAVAEIGEQVRVVGDDAAAVAALAHRIARPARGRLAAEVAVREPLEPDSIHRSRIERALEHIARGDVYVVNLARRFQVDVTGDAFGLLGVLGARSPARFAAAFAWDGLDVVSTSPELFLRTDPSRGAETWPIKGTRRRGRDAAEDQALAEELELDEKERAELAMVVDVERNDLGRVAVPGSVRLVSPPRVVTHRTVHHRFARVRAQLRSDVSREALLAHMLPSGSVTGAPKVRAMELIAELEAHRRGLYTGAFGALFHDGSLELAMAIRTLVARGGAGHYFAGGGIVADSAPEREVEETRLKALQVLGAP